MLVIRQVCYLLLWLQLEKQLHAVVSEDGKMRKENEAWWWCWYIGCLTGGKMRKENEAWWGCGYIERSTVSTGQEIIENLIGNSWV